MPSAALPGKVQQARIKNPNAMTITAVVYCQFRRQFLSLSPTRARPAPSVSAVSGTENENRKEEKPLAA